MNKYKVLGDRARMIFALFLILISAFWIWGYVSSQGLIDSVVRWMQDNASGEAVFYSLMSFWLFSAGSVLLGPFTSAPLVPIAILLWGSWATYWLLLSGWIAGGMIAYLIGSHLGRAIVLRIVSAQNILAWEEFITNRVNLLVAFLFRLAMPAETGYIFGVAHYDFGRYIFITATIEAITAAVLVFAGTALISRDFIKFMLYATAVVVVLGASAYILAKNIKKGGRY